MSQTHEVTPASSQPGLSLAAQQSPPHAPQSEAQLSHLLESGFVYISKEEDEFENMQEDIVIPVVRENQGELLQFTGVRPPLFATEDDIRSISLNTALHTLSLQGNPIAERNSDVFRGLWM